MWRDVLGCALETPYNSRGDLAWEGLENFIQRSCNRYMVEMATAALLAGGAPGGCRREDEDIGACLRTGGPGRGGAGAGPGQSATSSQGFSGGETTLRFCGRDVTVALTGDLPFTGESCGDFRSVDAGFAPGLALEELTGAAAYRDRAPPGDVSVDLDEAYRAGRFRLDLWHDPVVAMQEAGDTADPAITALRFSAVSPQVTNLALNTVEELRRDWINLLLGGENSRWTNFQLAEATSRLLTGRDIRGRLVLGVDADGEAGGSPEASAFASGEGRDRGQRDAGLLSGEVIHAGARRRVLHAMETVAQAGGGTAFRLRPALRQLEQVVRSIPEAADYEVYAFAKTGTPSIEVPVAGRMVTREGSVLVLGVLVVPPGSGRAASFREPDWISACPANLGQAAAILGIPPAYLLEGESSLGVSAAFYLDDRADGDPSATDFASELMVPLTQYLVQRLERRVRQEAFVRSGA